MPVKRYVVTGSVQGVGYRYFTFSLATRLGIRGFVRNLADGSVEIEAEGDAASLGSLVSGLAEGPDGSRVANLTEADLPDGGPYESFTIRG